MNKLNIVDLRYAIENCKQFPTMPTVITQILNMVCQDIDSLADIANVVRQDQAIASKVLSSVNSASFGLKYKITSLVEAINLLGLSRLTLLALETLILNPKQIETFNLSNFWQHTMGTSVAAGYFAKQIGIMGAVDLSITIGLVHDIGKLYFMLEWPEEYLAVQEEIIKTGQISQWVERQRLGVDHCQAGVLLARNWEWPYTTQQLILYHHYPYKSDLPQVAYFVYLANYASHYVLNDLYPSSYTLSKISEPILRRCPDLFTISEEVWQNAQKLIQKEMTSMNKLMGFAKE